MQNPLQFIKAGKAIFTVSNTNTGNRFSFKVKKCGEKELWFVSVLNGPDNWTNYRYIGSIFDKDFRLTKKSISTDAPSFKAFSWLNQVLNTRDLPEFVKIHHEGRCGRCGRRLTVPESVESGFGPECIQHIN